MSVNPPGRALGYLQLLRKNHDFRNLFLGQLVSQTGDWFNSVALFTLLLSLTGSGEAVGYVLIIKLLPSFFAGPLAGVVADRFNRKTIMIVADIVRGVLVLGFLFVQRPEQVWIVYAIAALEVVVSTFFDPAKSASIPNIVSRAELVPANALSAASWSVTLALGAALGGVVTDAFGRNTAFVVDSMTFFISAAYIARVHLRSDAKPARAARLSLAEATGVTDLIEGARYLRANPRVLALLLVKSGWGLGGGVLLLLTVYGKQIFPIGRDGAASIGLLYAARGFGALIGPMIAGVITSGSPRTMRKAISVAFFVSTAFYLLFAHSPALPVALICVIGAHSGGSIQWVFSTTLLQMTVPDRFLGRVFALEMALLTLTMSISTYVTGLGVDYPDLGPRGMATILGLAFAVPGIGWLMLQRWLDQGDESERGSSVAEVEPVAETSSPPV
ncbi:MAG TPA: MFS transporter [Blastocatellia bacterium]|nr:MFS transporter [Blastocatellia bacterium]